MSDPDVWPALLDMSRDDCKRILRRLELEAYSNLVSVLRSQGSLTAHKRRLLKSVAQALNISEERHKAECRRAVNSEKLATIAMHMSGANTGTEWAIEGRRLVPLLPRLVPQTAFTAIADKVAVMAVTEGAKLPLPVPTVKRRLQSPPIDETLLEPNIPEASKTLIVSSPSPSPRESGSSPQPTQLRSFSNPSTQITQSVTTVSAPVLIPKCTSPIPLLQQNMKVPIQCVSQSHQYPLSVSPVQTGATAPSQMQFQHSQLTGFKTGTEDNLPTDERVSRKRPRSASSDTSLDQDSSCSATPLMAPPVKKEALSPLSPHTTHAMQLSPTMSPQSHSQLVQQQTLQAAAAAAAAVSTSVAQSISPQMPAPSQSQVTQPHTTQQISNAAAMPQTLISSLNSPRTVTIPTQGTVKLCLGASAPSSGAGISPGTHKVIIVSSTAPSILQRSLSVPVVKTMTTSAPSLPSPSLPVLTQSSSNIGNGNNSRSANPESVNNVPPTPGNLSSASTPGSSTQLSNLAPPSKNTSKTLPPKARPRANSIVIPVTPNQASVLGTMSAGMQLKTALQASKQGVLKAGDTAGLKILPLSSMPSNAKILPKPAGSGPIYVVSSTSVASQNMSVVTRSVPSGTRMMTFTSSSLPRVAVSTSQGGAILSMSPKPVQTLQLSSGTGSVTGNTTGGVAGSGSGSSPATPKPNVIVVQKGATAFGRGTTIAHAGKDVVAKVLLGGKGLSSLGQSHLQASTLIQASTGQTLTQPVQILPSQVPTSHSSQSPGQIQSSQNTISLPSATTSRMVTIQKLPSTLVSGTAGTSNVIVFDLSQDQYSNSSVFNEIFGTSNLLGSHNSQTVNNETHSSKSISKTNYPVVSLSDCSDENNVTVPDGSSDATAESSSPARTSNSCSDIFSTALSNANLNLNDFLEDSSLDEIPSTPSEGMRLGLSSAENNSNSSHSNASVNPTSWVCSENSQNSLDIPDSNQV